MAEHVLRDPFGRTIEYLRMSITDRCNFRCGYCMPEDGVPFVHHGQIMSYEELLRIARVGERLGMRRVRITGGEPLVRKGVVDFVAGLRSQLTELEDLAMTTNGVLLANMAADLKAAGLQRVNVSLDTLDADKFRRITRVGDVAQVVAGIRAAAREGLRPLKLNAVLMHGINDDLASIQELLAFSDSLDATVRFIELMPMGITDPGLRDRYASAARVIENLCEAEVIESVETVAALGGGPAVYYPLRGGGKVGFITAISDGFCTGCSRLRLTADGKLFPCLASTDFVDLRGPIRAGADNSTVARLIEMAVQSKPSEHHFVDAHQRHEGMSRIGG